MGKSMNVLERVGFGLVRSHRANVWANEYAVSTVRVLDLYEVQVTDLADGRVVDFWQGDSRIMAELVHDQWMAESGEPRRFTRRVGGKGGRPLASRPLDQARRGS